MSSRAHPEQSLDALKRQCRELDREIRDHQHRWLANARDLSSVATAMARERYQLDLCDPQGRDGGNTAVLNRDLEVLVYTVSAPAQLRPPVGRAGARIPLASGSQAPWSRCEGAQQP